MQMGEIEAAFTWLGNQVLPLTFSPPTPTQAASLKTVMPRFASSVSSSIPQQLGFPIVDVTSKHAPTTLQTPPEQHHVLCLP